MKIMCFLGHTGVFKTVCLVALAVCPCSLCCLTTWWSLLSLWQGSTLYCSHEGTLGGQRISQ